MTITPSFDPSASDTASLSEIKTCLRISGVHGCGQGASEVLKVLRSILPRLLVLSRALPNLRGTISLLVQASRINDARPRSGSSTSGRQAPDYVVFNIVSWLLSCRPSFSDKLQEQVFLDVLALRWLHTTAMRCFSDQFTDWQSFYIKSPDHDFQEIFSIDALSNAIKQGAESIGYQNWINAIEELETESRLPSLFFQLQSIEEKPLTRSEPRPWGPELPRLDERQLSAFNWYFPRPMEHKKLKEFLTRELDPFSILQFKHEAGLIALSIILCRPIQAFLNWPVGDHCANRHGTNRIVIEDNHIHKEYLPDVFWLKSEHGIRGSTAKIEFDFAVTHWISFIHPKQGRHTLSQLLPFSSTPWDERSYACLAQVLGCSSERAELITRDFVPRLMYKKSANSSLVNFWRSDNFNKSVRADGVALSFYLRPSGERFNNTFMEATQEAWMSAGSPTSIDVKIGADPLAPDEIKHIISVLHKQREKSNDAIQQHNAIALLTLFICTLGTGHRRSTTPFPFPWDFSPSEEMVFICDKRVTGSEARFAPLTPTVMSYLAAYSAHLRRLSNNPKISSAAREYAHQTQIFLGFEREPFKYARRQEFIPFSGVFFELRGQHQTQSITTRYLDEVIESQTGIARATRRLRTTIAQYLWEQGSSGRTIQAFLGHQPEQHVHGPSSTWSVKDVAAHVVPIVESFFVRVLGLPEAPRHFWPPPGHCPTLAVASHDPTNNVFAPGYEGRERENAWAEQRARAIIRSELSEYLLASIAKSEDPLTQESQESRFTEEDRKLIEERVRSELGIDPLAQKKVASVISIQINRLRTSPRASIHVEAPSYRLSEPGPVDVHFSRSLRIALAMRSIWEKSAGVPMAHREFDPLERLAQLAISLVVLDGVLSIENLEGLVLAANDQVFETHDDQITLRCGVVTNTHDFEFCVQPGETSTALVFGCSSHEDFSADWEAVGKRAKAILQRLLRLEAGMDWSLARLCQVFRPYWLLRMSGAMYAVTIGQFKGPAADVRAQAQLHGKELPSEVLPGLTATISQSGQLKTPQELALGALRKLFTNAHGKFEYGQQRRMVQRAKLRESLRSEQAQIALHHGKDTQIVGLLLSFIGRLLDNGGPRKTRLAPSTIESYFTSIAKDLIELAWDFDFETSEPDALKDFFDSIGQKVSPGAGDVALQLFCSHLRDEVSIPRFNARWFNPREPVRVRSSLALPAHVSQAISGLNRKRDETARNAGIFLGICHAYGLRRREALGLGRAQFDELQPLHLSINRSPLADLKTPAGRRVIADNFASDSIKKNLKSAISIARSSSRDIGFLFESPTRDKKITWSRPITTAATEALRNATGSVNVVPHTLRHTFATILGLQLMSQPHGAVRHLPALEMFQRFQRFQAHPEIEKILQIPNQWPFGVDAIAAALGHSDCSTFLNVYFHGSHLLIAEQCARWQPKQITQVRLATMLNMERTTLSKLWTRIKGERGKFDAVAVVRKLTRNIDKRSSFAQTLPEVLDETPTPSRRWELFFRALLYRQEHGLSLDVLKTYVVDRMGFAPSNVDSVLEKYRNLVLECAFDDFEPADSELVLPVASHQEGLARGAIEREDFVARAQAWAESKPENATRLRKMTEDWHARVRADRPAIVCKDLGEFDNTMGILMILGAQPDQLDIQLHGLETDTWLGSIRDRHPNAPASTVRASRGSSRIRVAEVSIAVRQKAGSRIPDGRDLHRAFVGLYLATNSTL